MFWFFQFPLEVSVRRIHFSKFTSLLLLVLSAFIMPGVSLAESDVVPGEYVLEYTTPRIMALNSELAGLASSTSRSGRYETIKVPTVMGLNGEVEADHDANCAYLKAQTGASDCNPNIRFSIDAVPNDPMYDPEPTDSYSPGLWGLRWIKGATAWDTGVGVRDVVVAVLDTGVKYTHNDLAANMWTNPGEIPGNGIDDDANGYIDDYYGYDFANEDSDPNDDNGHGTHVAGTIGAVRNNSIGIAGVAPEIEIMGLKFLFASGGGTLSDAIAAMDYLRVVAAQYPLKKFIVNASFGGTGYSSIFEKAVQATATSGILFVAAAGNRGVSNDIMPHYPSSFDSDNVISVAASDLNGELAYFSNYGTGSVHIAAPGLQILSTYIGSDNDYKFLSGTSMAAPHVAGLAALLWSQNLSYGYDSIRSVILGSGDNAALAIETGAIINAQTAMAVISGGGIPVPDGDALAVYKANKRGDLQAASKIASGYVIDYTRNANNSGEATELYLEVNGESCKFADVAGLSARYRGKITRKHRGVMKIVAKSPSSGTVKAEKQTQLRPKRSKRSKKRTKRLSSRASRSLCGKLASKLRLVVE